jgi:hypothetical protein
MAERWPAEPPEGTLAPVRARREALETAASELEHTLAAPSATTQWRTGVVAALQRSGIVLDEHLHENQGQLGIPESVVQAEPRLAGPAEQLSREHDDLMSEHRRVSAVAVDASQPPDAVRDAAAGLATLMRRHVQHSHDLIYDAFEVELGGGD